jgi:dTDP-4-dehydrorhamnose reductase
VINATGYVQVDEAEKDSANCINVNAVGPALLAGICREKEIRFLSLSTDLVFSGNKGCAYLESDATGPLNVYGQSKVMAEQMMLENNPEALVIRTSSFFGPWDNHNFVVKTLNELKENRVVKAAADVVVSPTYIPDLVQASLDLLLDGDTGIYHITNKGAISWAEWAEKIAIMAGCDPSLVRSAFQKELKWKATRPAYSVLQSEKGIQLPDFEDAMERCFEALGNTYQSGKIAV